MGLAYLPAETTAWPLPHLHAKPKRRITHVAPVHRHCVVSVFGLQIDPCHCDPHVGHAGTYARVHYACTTRNPVGRIAPHTNPTTSKNPFMCASWVRFTCGVTTLPTATPRPFEYMMPRLYMAGANSRAAASAHHLHATAWFSSIRPSNPY